MRLSLLVLCALLATSVLAAPGSAGRDVLSTWKLDLAALLETQETEDTQQHMAQLHQLENFLTAEDDEEEDAEAVQRLPTKQAEEAAEMWNADDSESSKSEASEAAAPAVNGNGTPYDDLVSIFSKLGDKDAATNSRKILKSALDMHSAAMGEGGAAVASEVKNQESATEQTEQAEETEAAAPLITAAEDAEESSSADDKVNGALVPGVNETSPEAPIPRPPATNTSTNITVTPAPPGPKFVTVNYVKPVYDDAPNSISPDYEIKAVQGTGGWKKAKPVAKNTLGPCNKGDPCPPQPTADNPNPAPTQLQLNKIRADAEIQKQFGNKKVVEPKGWIRPTHAGCEGDCPKVDVSQSSSDGKFVSTSSIPSLPVEVRLNCEPKMGGQC